jgi:2-polyprenyl-3-methyl-5-hydroxy-6-metoxy-1,4-benzoquinol methylase
MLKCRSCKNKLLDIVINLENQPSANRLLTETEVLSINQGKSEYKIPLTVYLCNVCFLVQLGETEKPENLFTYNYPYYSSSSDEWLSHAKKFVYSSINHFNLTKDSKVLEIGSNDGYLLQHYVKNGIPCLGVDPAGKAATVAKSKNINTVIDFFNKKTAQKILMDYGKQDFIIGNNVFAHIPNILETIESFKICMSENSIISIEVPHLANLVENNLFDTIYDEHYFYFSVVALINIFKKFNLKIFKIEEHSLHGGSIRVYINHLENINHPIDPIIEKIVQREKKMGLDNVEGFKKLAINIKKIKEDATLFIKNLKRQGKIIASYGAAAKGNIFLNYCNFTCDDIKFIVDDTSFKQGFFLPGSHIPIYSPQKLVEEKPDAIIILPWNFRKEIEDRIKKYNDWGAQIITFIPKITIS